MSKILVIDTSTEACSVALQVGEQQYCEYKVAPREHGDLVLPMVDKLLKQADIKLSELDLIAYGQGPGAFTGLRICISIVQGLAFGADVPVTGISSLQAMAQAAYQEDGKTQVLSAIDARMGEVYWGQYQLNDGYMQLVGEELVCLPQDVTFEPSDASNYYGVGTGWQTYKQELTDILEAKSIKLAYEEEASFPHAKAMLSIANRRLALKQYTAAEQAQPVYLRNNVAKKKKEQVKQS